MARGAVPETPPRPPRPPPPAPPRSAAQEERSRKRARLVRSLLDLEMGMQRETDNAKAARAIARLCRGEAATAESAVSSGSSLPPPLPPDDDLSFGSGVQFTSESQNINFGDSAGPASDPEPEAEAGAGTGTGTETAHETDYEEHDNWLYAGVLALRLEPPQPGDYPLRDGEPLQLLHTGYGIRVDADEPLKRAEAEVRSQTSPARADVSKLSNYRCLAPLLERQLIRVESLQLAAAGGSGGEGPRTVAGLLWVRGDGARERLTRQDTYWPWQTLLASRLSNRGQRPVQVDGLRALRYVCRAAAAFYGDVLAPLELSELRALDGMPWQRRARVAALLFHGWAPPALLAHLGPVSAYRGEADGWLREDGSLEDTQRCLLERAVLAVCGEPARSVADVLLGARGLFYYPMGLKLGSATHEPAYTVGSRRALLQVEAAWQWRRQLHAMLAQPLGKRVVASVSKLQSDAMDLWSSWWLPAQQVTADGLQSLARYYETNRVRNYAAALALWRFLVALPAEQHPRRGASCERLVALLKRQGPADEALQACRRALTDPALMAGDRERLVQHLRDLQQQSLSDSDNETDAVLGQHRMSLSGDDVEEVPLRRVGRGQGTGAPNRDRFEDAAGLPVVVERAVLSYLLSRSHGRLRGLFAENRLWTTLFFAICFDEIFDSQPGAFTHAFQPLPTDLYDGTAFFERRRHHFARKFDAMRRESERELRQRVTAAWRAHAGRAMGTLVQWTLSEADAVEVAACAGARRLSLLFEAMARHPLTTFVGFPDLVLWAPGEPESLWFAEVKAPGDELSAAQIGRIRQLREQGFRASLVRGVG